MKPKKLVGFAIKHFKKKGSSCNQRWHCEKCTFTTDSYHEFIHHEETRHNG